MNAFIVKTPSLMSNEAFYLPEHSSIEELDHLAALLHSAGGPDRCLDLRLGIALLCFKMNVGGCQAYFLKSRTEVPYAILKAASPRRADPDATTRTIEFRAPQGLWLASNCDVAAYTGSVDAAFDLAEACGEDPELVLTVALGVELNSPAAVFVSDLARRFLICCLERLIIRAGLKESDLDES
jgi:hypothetical protein